MAFTAPEEEREDDEGEGKITSGSQDLKGYKREKKYYFCACLVVNIIYYFHFLKNRSWSLCASL